MPPICIIIIYSISRSLSFDQFGAALKRFALDLFFLLILEVSVEVAGAVYHFYNTKQEVTLCIDTYLLHFILLKRYSFQNTHRNRIDTRY